MKQTPVNTARLSLIIAMLIFGTIGIFRNLIPMPSSVIALIRGAGGTLFLVVFCILSRKKLSLSAIRSNLFLLVVSGAFIGFNWILLFEAYRYTSVPTATLCYYLAPVIVIVVSPILFKELLPARKIVCVAVALVGMVFVTGVADGLLPGADKAVTAGRDDVKGILFGLGAAVLYASVVLMNKKLSGVQAFERTVMQLGAAAVALVPYVLITGEWRGLDWNGSSIALLLVVAIVHTGISYALYFGAIKDLPAQTSALLSYIDPVSAILFSAALVKLLENEKPLTPTGIVGAVLVLGSTLLSELSFSGKKE